jgi:hypothetical protein
VYVYLHPPLRLNSRQLNSPVGSNASRRRLVVERHAGKKQQLTMVAYVGLVSTCAALCSCTGLAPVLPGPSPYVFPSSTLPARSHSYS